jgi:hypothetical protein
MKRKTPSSRRARENRELMTQGDVLNDDVTAERSAPRVLTMESQSYRGMAKPFSSNGTRRWAASL